MSGIEENYKFLYNTVNHLDKLSEKDEVIMMIKTVFHLLCLKYSGYFGDGKATLDNDELYIGGLLFHIAAGIHYNLHGVYKVIGDINKPNFLKDIGSAVYCTLLLFNHSCCPSTVRVYYDNKVVLYATRFISKGEEICDNYGFHHLSMDKNDRLASLKKGFAFNCTCQACDDNFPALKQLMRNNSIDQVTQGYLTK